MKTYTVLIAQWHAYEVETDDVDTAIQNAIDEFYSDMRSPIANTDYDELIVETNIDGEITEIYHS